MTSHLHQICPALVLLLAVPLLPAADDNGPTEANEDWSALLEEAETTADWAADPLADLNLFGDTASSLLLTASIRAGAGYSDMR